MFLFFLKKFKNVIHLNVNSIYLWVVDTWVIFTFILFFMKSLNFYNSLIYSFHISAVWYHVLDTILGTEDMIQYKTKSLCMWAYNVMGKARDKQK